MHRKGIVSVLFVLSFIVLLCFTLTSQNAIKGIVVGHTDKNLIPYVNIGIPDKNIGTLTDINGNFFLDVRRSNIKNPQIKFSAIGFESVVIDYDDLLQRDSIFMIPRNYEIENIDIRSKPLGKEVTLGKRIDKKVAEIALGSSAKLGYEIGTKIKIKQKVWIKSVHFGLSDSTSDSILFRVNVYEMTNDIVGKNLLTQNVLVYSRPTEPYISVDLRAYNVITDSDVLISLESVEERSEKHSNMAFRVKKSLGKSNVYIRSRSQGKFEKIEELHDFGKVNIAYYLIANLLDE